MRRIHKCVAYVSAPEMALGSCTGCDLIEECLAATAYIKACDKVIWKREKAENTDKPQTPSHLINRHFINNLWRWKCGLPETEEVKMDVEKLRVSQMSGKFIELMENRMILGTMRYGRWQENRDKGVKYNRVASIRKRLDLFEKTGNTEYLVDVANLAMIEFEISDHPNKHFSPVDDGDHHVSKI